MPDPLEISRYCSSLVVVVSTKGRSQDKDDEHMELQIAHFSVKEYLTSNCTDKDIAQNFQEAVAKASIATVCLAYLLHLDFDLDLPTRRIKETFPLAQYSARYWMINATVAEGEDETVQGLVIKLFCSHQRSYKICYSLYRPDQPPPGIINITWGNLAPPLYYASFGGFRNAVQSLLNRNADINAQGGNFGNALQAALTEGHEKVVELLLRKGADINAQGGCFDNALQAASYGGHEKIVELLLRKGADVNVQGGHFGNVLQAASYKGRWKVVELLLRKGADVNAQGGEYSNALQAASYGDHEKIVELLLRKGANVNAQGGEYGNALQAASAEGHEKVVELLLRKGADVNALQAALYRGRTKTVELREGGRVVLGGGA
jgi:ankyrin repeat protein